MNVTVFYPDFIPSNEFSLLHGKSPSEIWYFVEVIPFHEIPGVDPYSGELVDKSGESLSDWLKDIWAKKEEMLKEVHEDTKTEQNGEIDSLAANGYVSHQGQGLSNSEVNNEKQQKVQSLSEKRRFSGSTSFSAHNEVKLKSQSQVFNCLVFIWWSFFAVVAIYLSITSFWTQMYILLVVGSFLAVSWKYGSWDKLEADVCFNDKRLKLDWVIVS